MQSLAGQVGIGASSPCCFVSSEKNQMLFVPVLGGGVPERFGC